MSNTFIICFFMVLTILSLFLFGIYLCWNIIKFGVPSSLSVTFYLIDSKYRWLFPATLSVMVFLLAPVWIDVTIDFLKFMPFIACFGILLVAAAPYFRDWTPKIHTAGATISGIITLVWSFIHVWWMPVISILIFIYPAVKFKSQRVFYVEMACFFMAYASLIYLYMFP